MNTTIHVLIMLGMLLMGRAEAATLYVDKDNGSAGDGSSGNPYQNLQSAFNVVTAGDTVRIRPSATPYDGTFSLDPPHTGTNPTTGRITIESDPDGNGSSPCVAPYTNATTCPILRYTANGSQTGVINLTKVSYITVQHLTFDGAGVWTSAYVLHIQANPGAAEPRTGVDMFGIEVLDNQFLNWGGTAAQASTLQNRATIALGGAGTTGGGATCTSGGPPDPCPGVPQGLIIRGNTFDNSRQSAISIQHATNTLVESNTIKHMTCGKDVDQARNTLGTKTVGTYTVGTTIRNNVIEDFERWSDCGVTHVDGTFDTMAAIWCDVDPKDGFIERNLIRNLNFNDPNDQGQSFIASVGILNEIGCSGWVIRNNVIHHIGLTNIVTRQSNNQSPTSWLLPPTYILNNTLYAGFQMLRIVTGDAVVKNNLVIGAGTAWHLIGSPLGPPPGHWDINNNLYYDTTGDTHTGFWNGNGGGIQTNLATWKTNCSCDAASTFANPNFVSTTAGAEDLRICVASGNPGGCVGASPAINAGVTLANVTDDFTCDPPAACVTRPQGSAYDIGAYEMVTGGDVTPPAAPTNLRVVSP